MLKRLIRLLRRAKQRRYIKTLEKQLDTLFDQNAPGSQVEAKRAAITRARQRLAPLLMACVIFPACAHANNAARETIEVAVIAVDEAQERCAKKLAHLDGDQSQKAVQARRDCLRMPDLGETQDAVDALSPRIEIGHLKHTFSNDRITVVLSILNVVNCHLTGQASW